MQHNNVPSWEEIERKVTELEETVLEIRIRNLEHSLASRNATTERVLASCRRIQSAWNTPAARKENEDDNAGS